MNILNNKGISEKDLKFIEKFFFLKDKIFREFLALSLM